MNKQILPDEMRRLAEAVRQACIEAAIAGYEQAAMDGLCHEGATECAVSAIRMVNIENIIQGQQQLVD